MLPGYATAEGTSRYRERFPQLRDAMHFRRPEHVPGAAQLWLSSIGLGTYLGEPDDNADSAYVSAISGALRSGINLIDTAINYRHQRSERNIATALQSLIASGKLNRDEVMICTKAGYLSFDGAMPSDPRGYFMREYVESGTLDPKDLAGGMHCISPAYLGNQIERSRRNLGVETIDLFYVHNPETQAAELKPEAFHRRLKDAFVSLEREVKAGKLRFYGMATWNAFRVAPDERDYISLPQAVAIAREAGGEHHHFRFVQLPFNLAMTEAFGVANQHLDRKDLSLLTAAARLGIAVIGSATLHQGHLTHNLPQFISQVLGMNTDAGNAIQFSRSAPGLTSALIGMAKPEHVSENLTPALAPPTPAEEWIKLFSSN